MKRLLAEELAVHDELLQLTFPDTLLCELLGLFLLRCRGLHARRLRHREVRVEAAEDAGLGPLVRSRALLLHQTDLPRRAQEVLNL